MFVSGPLMMDNEITKRKHNDTDNQYQHKRSNLNDPTSHSCVNNEFIIGLSDNIDKDVEKVGESSNLHSNNEIVESSNTNKHNNDITKDIEETDDFINLHSEYNNSKVKIQKIQKLIAMNVHDRNVFCKYSKRTENKCIYIVKIGDVYNGTIQLNYNDLNYLIDNYSEDIVMNIMRFLIFFSKFRLVKELQNLRDDYDELYYKNKDMAKLINELRYANMSFANNNDKLIEENLYLKNCINNINNDNNFLSNEIHNLKNENANIKYYSEEILKKVDDLGKNYVSIER